MGQYYKALLIDPEGSRQSLNSWAYDNGSKLLEHSYVGNNFVAAVMNRLFIAGPIQRVAWVGDYSKDWNEHGFLLGHGYVKGKKDFQKYYNACWSSKVGVGEQPCSHHIFDSMMPEDFLREDYFLINVDAEEYVSFKDHVARNSWVVEWDGQQHLACLHPLPLLTAVGNNQGGGDYYDSHEDYHEVGTWAFDRIYISTKPPKDYTLREITFAKNIYIRRTKN